MQERGAYRPRVQRAGDYCPGIVWDECVLRSSDEEHTCSQRGPPVASDARNFNLLLPSACCSQTGRMDAMHGGDTCSAEDARQTLLVFDPGASVVVGVVVVMAVLITVGMLRTFLWCLGT